VNARVLLPAEFVQVAPPVSALALAAGTTLRGWRVVGTIGQGGFGIVYRAEDDAGRPVAIKEYLPAQLAVRDADGALAPASPQVADTFAAGLRGFVEEARLLAGVRHPGLVEVLDAWEAQGTAYMAMPLYEGRTLERLIAERPQGLDAPTLEAVVVPLMGALEAIHAAGCVHRDVSPDNVIVRPGGGAVLLDLGAARRVVGDRVRATTVMLKAGYAPIEQYADDPDCRIGPWSDVYALAAVMHHAMTGEAPPPAPLRVMRDTRVPLAGRCPAGYAPGFAEAVDAAMALRPQDRPQSIDAFRARLGLPAGIGAPRAAAGPGAAAAPVVPAPRRSRRSSFGMAAVAVAVFVASLAVWLKPIPGTGPLDAPADVAPPPLDPVEQAARDAAADARRPPPDAAAEAARQAAARPATLRLVVAPWAEVWVDGTKRGVTPPMTTLALTPGVHRVELRNPAAEPVVRRIDAKAGQTVELTHRFEAAPETRR
jgi:hypothetical protein